MKFAEIRVIRSNARVERVEWEDPRSDGQVFDLTGMRVLQVESVIEPGGIPAVKVTFRARIVELDAETAA